MKSEFKNKSELQPVIDDFIKQLKSRFGEDVVEVKVRKVEDEYFSTVGWIKLVNHQMQIELKLYNTSTSFRHRNGNWYIRANFRVGYSQNSWIKLAENKDYFPWFDEKVSHHIESLKQVNELQIKRMEKMNIAHKVLVGSEFPYDKFDKSKNILNPNDDGGFTIKKTLYVKGIKGNQDGLNQDNIEELFRLARKGYIEVNLHFDIEDLEELKEILTE